MEDVSVNAVFPALQEVIADELVAAYQLPGHGSGYFPPGGDATNLLVVVRDQACLHDVRAAHIARVQGADPAVWVTTERAMRRYLQLNPLFARHLAANGRRLGGEALIGLDRAPVHHAEEVAFLAQRALVASAALAPARLHEKRQVQAAEQLAQLASFLTQGQALPSAAAAEQFALVQRQLQQGIEELGLRPQPQEPIQDASAPNLEAMYEDGEFLLVVIPPLAAPLLRRLDWGAVLGQSPEHLTALSVGTAGELQLAVQSERPLDYLLASFRHLWGRDPLAGLQVSAWAAFRQAARKPAELLRGLSAEYVQAGDDQAVQKVIHDYQNRLLNLRLEHELLHRTQGVERAGPEEELPRRNEPNDVRIEAIATHLEWWAAYYAEKMAAAPDGEKMTPNEA